MNHGSLFSGIGGFDLASEWMGWDNVFHCEIEEFPRKVLNYYWPNTQTYEDITKTDFTIWRGRIDILSGGFPCQPFSHAGKQLGTEDDRHLWPEMLRAIQEIQPRWVVGENVLGILNWDGGLVFDQVQTDLETEGYEVQTYVLPAAGVNAPHRRDRVWFVAHSKSFGYRGGTGIGSGTGERIIQQEEQKRREMGSEDKGRGGIGSTAHSGHSELQESEQRKADYNRCSPEGARAGNQSTSRSWDGTTPDSNDTRTRNNLRFDRNGEEENKRRERQSQSKLGEGGIDGSAPNTERVGSPREEHRKKESRFNSEKGTGCGWRDFPTQSPVRNGNDGISTRLDGITFPKWRNESIKGAGNAIVPQVAHHIFKAIEQYENTY